MNRTMHNSLQSWPGPFACGMAAAFASRGMVAFATSDLRLIGKDRTS
jgi:hypothetical protein